MSVGVCYTAVDAAAGGLTTGWRAVVLGVLLSTSFVVRVCVPVSGVFSLSACPVCV